jgi:aspartokinase
MAVVVKFGGSSVANISRIRMVAELVVKKHVKRGERVVVVVSAMAGVTDNLSRYVTELGMVEISAERDVVLSAGEQITTALLAMAITDLGYNAQSFLCWQLPIVTNCCVGNARIVNVSTGNLINCFMDGTIPVVAGFQGMTEHSRITTLGRGGSDTTAVAIAAALKAKRCDIYTDVDGVYTADPRVVRTARKMARISYEEMLEMAAAGAKVLQTRSIELAMRYSVPVRVLSTFVDGNGTEIGCTCAQPSKGNVQRAGGVYLEERNASERRGAALGICDNLNLGGSTDLLNGAQPMHQTTAFEESRNKSNVEKYMESVNITGIASKQNIVKFDVYLVAQKGTVGGHLEAGSQPTSCSGSSVQAPSEFHESGFLAKGAEHRSGAHWEGHENSDAGASCQETDAVELQDRLDESTNFWQRNEVDPKRGALLVDVLTNILSLDVPIDLISQNSASVDTVSFTVEAQFANSISATCEELKKSGAISSFNAHYNVARVSIVGVGLALNNKALIAVLQTFESNNIPVVAITSTPLSICVITTKANVELAVLAVHSLFDCYRTDNIVPQNN